MFVILFFPTDIQECYEVTLQLNEEQTAAKEDGGQDAWEVIFFLTLPSICFMFTSYPASCCTAASRSLVAASVRCHYLRFSLLDMDEAERRKQLRGQRNR